jgi:TRAP-type uncharacterized transport system fused permease subunit
LYFFAVWVGINAYAGRYDLAGLAEEDRPSPRAVIVTSAFFAVPFAVLMWGMFVTGMTPQYAASMAILVGFVMLFFHAGGSFDLDRTLGRLENAVINAARQVSMIAAIILCASIIIGVLSITGLGVKITSLILSASGGMLWPSLLLTALACLVLGMEVPTTAAYVICVSVAGPALTKLGLEPLQAHLFVFWFALLSTITPPVCGAVFIAAGMIGENWLKVAVTAMSLGVGLYIIPLTMVANPAIMEIASAPLSALVALAQIGLGLALISYALIGAFKPLHRVGLGVAGFAVLFGPVIIG